MFPDGGIARLRAYGVVVVFVFCIYSIVYLWIFCICQGGSCFPSWLPPFSCGFDCSHEWRGQLFFFEKLLSLVFLCSSLFFGFLSELWPALLCFAGVYWLQRCTLWTSQVKKFFLWCHIFMHWTKNTSETLAKFHCVGHVTFESIRTLTLKILMSIDYRQCKTFFKTGTWSNLGVGSTWGTVGRPHETQPGLQFLKRMIMESFRCLLSYWMWMDGGWMRMMKMTRIAFRLNTTLTKVQELAATTLHVFGIFFFKTLISYFHLWVKPILFTFVFNCIDFYDTIFTMNGV